MCSVGSRQAEARIRSAGRSEDQIITDYPELERDDFRAVYEYAARVGRRVAL